MTSTSRRICKICLKQFAKYTCPRCKTVYCSLECYTQHGISCTEEFYKGQVHGELQATHTDEEEKRRLLEIFNRFQNQRDSSSEDDQQSESNLDWMDQFTEEDILKIQQDDFDLSEQLPDSLIQEFEDLLRSRNAYQMIEVFTPWWESVEAQGLQLSNSGTALVQELETGSKDLIESLPKLPETPIPQLQSLTKAPMLSESIRWQLLQVYLVYCYVLRQYNGDWSWDSDHLGPVLYNLATCFDPKNTPLCSAKQTVEEFIEIGTKPPIGSSKERRFLIMTVLKDAMMLISKGRSVMILALSDFTEMITHVETKIKVKREKDAVVNRLKFGARKLTFLLSWVNCPNNDEQLEVLLLETQQISETLSEGLITRKPIEVISKEEDKASRTLITEL